MKAYTTPLKNANRLDKLLNFPCRERLQRDAVHLSPPDAVLPGVLPLHTNVQAGFAVHAVPGGPLLGLHVTGPRSGELQGGELLARAVAIDAASPLDIRAGVVAHEHIETQRVKALGQ